MTLRSRRRRRAESFRPAESYLAAGAEQARALGHSYVGTEHVLLSLARLSSGTGSRILADLGASADAIRDEILAELGPGSPRLDPQALATLGIDLDVVRSRLDEAFGPGSLEETRSACLGVAPRLKMALAYSVDHAGDEPLADEHVLLGMLTVEDSMAAQILRRLGIDAARVRAAVTQSA
jgi:ATP-dependent Clp protease ATP-binding subunit ClpA